MNKNIVALIFAGCFASLYAMEPALTERMGRLSLAHGENVNSFADEMIKVADAQGAIYDISKQAAMHAGFIKGILEEPEYTSEEALPLLNISGEVMPRLINRLNLLTQSDGKETIKNQLQNVSMEELLTDVRAAEYVDAPELLLLTVQALAMKLLTTDGSVSQEKWRELKETICSLNPFLQSVVWDAYGEMQIVLLKENARWDIEAKHVKSAHVEGEIIAFSPDGRRIMTRISVQVVRIYDVDNLQAFTDIVVNEPNSTYGITVVAFSHDNTTVAVGMGHGHLYLYNAHTGALQEIIENTGQDSIASIIWSSDDHFMAYGLGRDIYIVNMREEVDPIQLRGRGNRIVEALAFSPDAQMIAVGSFDGNVRVLNISTKTEKNKMRASAQLMSWSRDGQKIIISARDGLLYLWDLATARDGTPIDIQKIIGQEVIKSIELSLDKAKNAKIILRLKNGATYILHQPAVENFITTLNVVKEQECVDVGHA